MTMGALLASEEGAFPELRRGSVVAGTVVRIDADEVLVDIGLKSEGIIPNRELGNPAADLGHPLQVGDRILAYVLQPETPEGHAVLSYRRAGTERLWHRVTELLQSGEVLEAPVVDRNRGGLVVEVAGLRGFVPISQLESLHRTGEAEEDLQELDRQLQALVGTRIQVKVIEVDRRRSRLILSERLALRDQRSHRRDVLLQELEPGQVRRGRVSNLASFGAFIDLGGVDGLVHVSELSWGRVRHPSELLTPGQEVEVYVLAVDPETRKIALSLKRTQPDPWEAIEQRYEVGQLLSGEVVKHTSFGVFVRVEEGVEGLVHNTEIGPADRQRLQEGQVLPFRVINIDQGRRRLRLTPAFEEREALDQQRQEASGPSQEPA